MGLKFAQALEPYGLYFLEEPCWPEAIQGLAEINRAARLEPAERVLEFPSDPDSNSPAFWSDEIGRPELVVLNSAAGRSDRSSGAEIAQLAYRETVTFSSDATAPRWLEAIVADVTGVLYGYYHSEPPGVCGESSKTAPRIGAARSTDYGRSWEDLGILLESPPSAVECDTPNPFFVGGVGDFSVILDPDARDLYFFFTHYGGESLDQGVAVARLLWAYRDAPAGKATVWADGAWLPAVRR